MADFEGTAFELPYHKGFSLRIDMGNFDPKQKLIRVTCPSPRTEQNYDQVDKAINQAINQFINQNNKETVNIQELQNVMTKHPLDGIVTRKEFNNFCIGGHKIEINNLTVIASHNYKCLEPYSQDQKIQLMGILLTVYLDNERSQSTVIHKPEEIEPTIQSLKEQCEKLCNHKLRKELSYQTCKERNIPHSGMHCHVFECFSCKKILTFDSSG